MLSPQQGEDSIRLRAAALRRNWSVVRWSSWQLPPGLKGRDACLYASPLFAERVSQLLGLKFTEPPDDWLLSLPRSLLHREIMSTTLREARSHEKRAFFKPAAFKTFTAGVYASGGQLPDESKADQETPVLISEVVHWESEFRFFILDGKAVTGSPYYRNGKSAEVVGESTSAWPSSPEEFALAKNTAEAAYRATADSLPRSVVIDTGYIRGLGWAVIEANPSWGSGLYGCDESLVLDVIAAAVEDGAPNKITTA